MALLFGSTRSLWIKLYFRTAFWNSNNLLYRTIVLHAIIWDILGIYLTIKNIARDSNIRIMLYKVVRDQISLINNASFAERDRLLRKSVKQVLNKIEVHEDSNLKIKEQEIEVSQMVQEVLNEINAHKNNRTS